MTVQATMSGARLSFVVVPIEGNVSRPVHRYSKDKGITVKDEDQAGGYLVYFPRGHALRIRNKDELKRYKLDKKPRIISLQGLNDPNSAIGQLMAAQDDASRQGAMVSLEKQVIALATAKTGNVLMPEQVREVDDMDDDQSGKLVIRPNAHRRPKAERKVA